MTPTVVSYDHAIMELINLGLHSSLWIEKKPKLPFYRVVRATEYVMKLLAWFCLGNVEGLYIDPKPDSLLV